MKHQNCVVCIGKNSLTSCFWIHSIQVAWNRSSCSVVYSPTDKSWMPVPISKVLIMCSFFLFGKLTALWTTKLDHLQSNFNLAPADEIVIRQSRIDNNDRGAIDYQNTGEVPPSISIGRSSISIRFNVPLIFSMKYSKILKFSDFIYAWLLSNDIRNIRHNAMNEKQKASHSKSAWRNDEEFIVK